MTAHLAIVMGEEMGEQQKELFRKVSLERLSSPEQLDTLTRVADPAGWVALIVLGCIIGVALMWGFWGSIPVKVSGKGILSSEGGVSDVVSLANGQISSIFVRVNDFVTRGQVVARIDHPELFDELLNANSELAELTSHQKSASTISKINDLERRITLMKNRLNRETRVISRVSGKVIEVKAPVGSVINVGAPLITVEQQDKKLEVLMYVSSSEGKKIKPGMEINIVPSSVMKEEYGSMLALVSSVSDYPSSYQGMMMQLLENESLAKSLTNGASVYEVHAELIPDNTTLSGYKWSSGKGAPVSVLTGTLCTGEVAVEYRRPISFIIPYIR